MKHTIQSYWVHKLVEEYVTDTKNDGSYTLNLNEAETSKLFQELDEVERFSIAQQCKIAADGIHISNLYAYVEILEHLHRIGIRADKANSWFLHEHGFKYPEALLAESYPLRNKLISAAQALHREPPIKE